MRKEIRRFWWRLGGIASTLRDQARVLGVAQRGVLEERMDRRQAEVAGPRGVVALGLEMFKERADRRRVEVASRARRVFAGLLLDEASSSRNVSR